MIIDTGLVGLQQQSLTGPVLKSNFRVGNGIDFSFIITIQKLFKASP